MTSLAPTVIYPMSPALAGAGWRAAPRDLPRLLKVRTTHAVLLTLLVDAQYWFQMASGMSDQPRVLVDLFVGMLIWNLGWVVPAFILIALVQAGIAPGRTRLAALFVAIVGWSEIWSLVPQDSFVALKLGLTTPESLALEGWWTHLVYLMLAAWYYESADRAQRSTLSFRQSELLRQGAERWLLELRLGSLQARIDPRVLFDTLDEAARLYRSRPAAAVELLDALIDYLRRALPQLRQPQSNLGREVALARACARVLRTRDGRPIAFDASVDTAADDARFPPMVLQPLCEALARSALAGGGSASVHISGSRENDMARLCVTAAPMHSPLPRECLAEIRRTLLAMFGPLVSMGISGPTAGVVRVLVEVPYEATPRADR